MNKEELKPCPFCGSNSICIEELRELKLPNNMARTHNYREFRIRCGCGIQTEVSIYPDMLVDIWNRRVK